MKLRLNPGIGLLAMALALAMAQGADAGKYNRKLRPGDAAPDWSGLVGVDDKKHSLADYREAKAVVIVFFCNHCPVAQAYEERLKAIDRDYRTRGVRLVAINPSDLELDCLPAMKERARTNELKFPYLNDAGQKTAKAYGARVTPEVFVLDRQRKVVYMGAIDDNWSDAGSVKKHLLGDALEAVLAGREADVAETKALGCGIDFED